MSTYDDVPYPSGPIRAAHPDRLAALAALCGLSPAPVERCRVLELGCSDGGNIAPLAELLPESEFVGIDNSPRQIDDGRRIVESLGLSNVRLECLDLLQLAADIGEFDYIICHGVFSWVPREVQDRILQICGRHLAPQGVAFVSYNTFPGWHLRGMLREMMLMHVAEFPDPQTRINQAQAFLDFLVRFVPEPDKPYAQFLQQECARLKQRPRTYLFHEHLETYNSPLYFRDFMQRAGRAGLQYLGDDTLPFAWQLRAHPDAAQLMRELDDDIERREQYLDFLQGCCFRQTLLVRQEAPLNTRPQSTAVRRFWLSSGLAPTSPVADIATRDPVEFKDPQDRSVELGDPVVKAAILHLSHISPQSVRYEELLSRAREMLPAWPSSYSAGSDAVLADALLQCVAAGLVQPSLSPPRFSTRVPERPRTTACARFRAANDLPVTTVAHFHMTPAEIHRILLAQLDGRHDVPALVACLAELAERGALQIESDNERAIEPAERNAALETVVRDSLKLFAKSALLVEPPERHSD
jgi:SAM-dependent methyltransferase